jgi:hypothetical protein
VDPSTGKGLDYAGAGDAVLKIFRAEGPLAFYKGFAPHLARTGPHYMLIFLFMDLYQVLMTSPPPSPPSSYHHIM